MTAPWPLASASFIAARISRASATLASEGVKTSLASLTWLGWIAHLPTMPIVAERRAWAVKPSASEKSPKGPSTGRTPLARQAATIAAVTAFHGSP